MKFRKKPVEIDAFQWQGDKQEREWPEWFAIAVGVGDISVQILDTKRFAKIKTLEGVMTAMPSDWIIRGVKGEIYPCKPDIFAATYDAV